MVQYKQQPVTPAERHLNMDTIITNVRTETTVRTPTIRLTTITTRQNGEDTVKWTVQAIGNGGYLTSFTCTTAESADQLYNAIRNA